MAIPHKFEVLQLSSKLNAISRINESQSNMKDADDSTINNIIL